MAYLKRTIDTTLIEWQKSSLRKPLLIRGARQTGKSTAVRMFAKGFESCIEVNFEREASVKDFFEGDLDVKNITRKLAAYYNIPVNPGRTLLFLDEIQACPRAIEALRFFKEDYPELHVIAAGSLLEFVLEELPSFGVGRIRSLFMYPLSFDEFLAATGNEPLLRIKRDADVSSPPELPFHNKLTELYRTWLLTGGMPEAVAAYIQSGKYGDVVQILDDIIVSYEDDFSKYRKKIDPELLRQCVRAVVRMTGSKYVYSRVGKEYRSEQVRAAMSMLTKAGIVIPVTHSAADGPPIGSGADTSYRKYLFFDTGLMLRMEQLRDPDKGQEQVRHILSANAKDLVNKGALAEMAAGLELIRYGSPTVRRELFYWVRTEKNSVAEIDYIMEKNGGIIPVEVKAGVRGGMKSLYYYMQKKNLPRAYRLSLENFSTMMHDGRQIDIIPLYAVSNVCDWHK